MCIKSSFTRCGQIVLEISTSGWDFLLCFLFCNLASNCSFKFFINTMYSCIKSRLQSPLPLLFPSHLLFTSPVPLRSLLPICFCSERVGLPWVFTKHGKSSLSRAKLHPSYCALVRQPSMRPRLPKSCQSIRDRACSHGQESHK